ncbi:MAG: hypothetical protein LUH05_08740, partial [Candidatus Gastranaerophilales bacterium]|nr:hypothetical protein [Candidatus Gastranaerophilales bacterium]
MDSNIIDKIKNYYKNPIVICGLTVVILSLILLFGCHFQLPEFYTDKQLAENIAQAAASGEVYNSVKHLLNPKYRIF